LILAILVSPDYPYVDGADAGGFLSDHERVDFYARDCGAVVEVELPQAEGCLNECIAVCVWSTTESCEKLVEFQARQAAFYFFS
jgi:hypothetical protein